MPRYDSAEEPRPTAGSDPPGTRVLALEAARKARQILEGEVELARAELASDLRAARRTAIGLAVAAVAGLAGVTLLLVAVALALALYMTGWLAALVVAVLTLGASAAIGLVAWSRRPRTLLAMTFKTLKENVQWVKERWA